jgi:hypothetical protein
VLRRTHRHKCSGRRAWSTPRASRAPLPGEKTGVRIKDERDGFAIDFAHDSVWFRILHFWFLCQAGALGRRFGLAGANCQIRWRRHDADQTKAKHMPPRFARVAVTASRRTPGACATKQSSRKRRPRLQQCTLICRDARPPEHLPRGGAVRIEH